MAIERVELKLNDGITNTPHLTDEVEIMQRHLRDWGVLPRDAKIDGMFGPATQAAVELFQKKRPPSSKFVPEGLQVTGVIDRNTWAELMKVNPEEIIINGSFTGVGLSDFILGDRRDFFNARRIAVGLDRTDHFRDIAQDYFNAIT